MSQAYTQFFFLSLSLSVFLCVLPVSLELPSNEGRAENSSIMRVLLFLLLFSLHLSSGEGSLEQFKCRMILQHSVQDTLRESSVISQIRVI